MNQSHALRDAAWHAQLELLCSLPYPAQVLMPGVLAALRSGFQADFGNFGWVAGDSLTPVAFWSERITEPVLRFMQTHHQALFDEFPLRQQLESDGDVARQVQMLPGYEEHWHLRELLAPMGVRWAMAAPVRDVNDACTGFLYLYRSAAAGPFSDAEQTRLRRARDCLRALGRHTAGAPGPLRPGRSALMQLDESGRLAARTPLAFELLYLCHDARVGMLDWAAADWSALPGEARALAQQMLTDRGGADHAQCRVVRAAGSFDIRLDRLWPVHGGAPLLTVTLTHMEPVDLAVARGLLHWPLSPREKRLLVASVRQPSHRELAQHLGITVSTLKTYVNDLQARFEVTSRQALIDRILAAGAESRHGG